MVHRLAAQTAQHEPPSKASEKSMISVAPLAPSPKACIGQPTIDLEAVLTNRSEKSIELSADGVVHDVLFRRFVSNKPVDGTGLLLDFKPIHWTNIAPHQTVVIPFSEPITDKVFMTAGLFTVEINFEVILKNSEQHARSQESIPSNRVFFLLAACNGDSMERVAPH